MSEYRGFAIEWTLLVALVCSIPLAVHAESDQEDRVVLGKNLVYAAGGHADIKYVSSNGGNTVSLFGLSHVPFQCKRPDMSVPIALPCGPNPYSQPIALFAVMDTTDLQIEVLSDESGRVAIADFDSLLPGPYGIRFEGTEFLPGVYWVQLHWSGIPVGKTLLGYTGPK